ncbi:MAG TPA: hypothetical protein VGJ34_06820 [Gaiellaceae bacterium]|jgi:hypothetical protein
MPRFAKILLLLTVTAGLAAPAALAGAPHQVGTCTATQSGNTLTINCKEAGLGDETQILTTTTATALCINNGGNHPRAVNKASVSSTDTTPVQNGKANITITLTATFSPDCSPPMTVQFTDVLVFDNTNGYYLEPFSP